MSRRLIFENIRFPRPLVMNFVRIISITYLAGWAGFATPARAQIAAVVEEDGKRVFINDQGTVSFRPAVGSVVPDSFTTRSGKTVTRDQIQALASDAADRYQVDPALVHAIITAESGWNPSAVSRKGAQGLMQLMPATASELGVKDPFDPRDNIEGGVKHLRGLLEKYDGDLDRTLAAYNAGGGAVDRAGGVPNYRETRDYVQKIQDAYFQSGSGRQPRFWRARRSVYQAMDERGKKVFSNE